MTPEDLMSTLFTLDTTAKSMERESLNVGIVSVLGALKHATDALRDVVVPSGQVLFGPTFRPYPCLYAFCILTIVFLQFLIAHSRGKSQFLRQQKEAWDRLIEEAWLHGEVIAQLVAAQ